VERPEEGGVQIGGNSRESLLQLLRVSGVHLTDVGEPPELGALEEEGLAVGPGGGGLQVVWEGQSEEMGRG